MKDLRCKFGYHKRDGELTNNGLLAKEWYFYCPRCKNYYYDYFSGMEDIETCVMDKKRKENYLKSLKRHNIKIKLPLNINNEKDRKGGVKMPRIFKFVIYFAITILAVRIIFNIDNLAIVLLRIFGINI